MNFSTEPSLFNFPFNRGEHEQDLHEVEVSSKRALQRINILYEEIMRPGSNNEPRNIEHFDERNVLNNRISEGYSNDSPKSQKHYLKSCCTTLQELCLKCDNFISRCSSCNRCNCSDTNVLKNKRRERSINSGRSVHQTSYTNLTNPTVKCTIPKPFSLVSKNYEWLKAKEIKISKLKEELNNKIENELKVKIHTKPVPKTTHLPLYSQMVLNKQKRKADRKEKCLEILSNTKPFDLHYKCKEKSKSASDLAAENVKNFKAKPLPKHILSDKVSEKLKNKEEVRKMLSAERALQILEQSSSPFSERSIPRSRSMIDISNFTKKSNKDYSKRNISEITKRLYVKKCNETMNSWNEKVMQVDTCKKLGQMQQNLPDKHINKNKVSTTQTMSFLYFPVRMSNAALLRDKQIRERISARNIREKRTQLTEDLTKKKINKDIAIKLRRLIPTSEREKDIDEKVKSYRVWQLKRQEEYDQELQEIMTRVAEQSLLLERMSKVTKKVPERKAPFGSGLVENDSDSTSAASEAVGAKDTESNTSASETAGVKDDESNSSAVEAAGDSSQTKLKESPSTSEANDS